MKPIKISFVVITSLFIAACTSAKKTTTSAAPAAPAPTFNYVLVKPDDGTYEPRNEELAAIQVLYKDATLEMLKEGHKIYTAGACINCHRSENIYKIPEAKWKDILEDMAHKAKISETQKDAVYKYVLAVKAVHPK